PVANATITPGPLSHPVRPGDPVTLRCSVQVGSAPVTFTWLRDGQNVSHGPLLDLGNVDVEHSGTYQCVATNQLGQDGHSVFRALSPELALEVTPRTHGGTVAAGVIVSLLFLVLLLGVIGGWRRWHRRGGAPPASPEDGEVLYTHVVSTKKAGGPPGATSPRVTYAELPGPHGRQRDPSDIYENVL
ncbi:CXAR protein, partial [Orthonyx spaldingii]|nr:CXAR protein [Orthonyx spaldingii]